MIRRSFQDLSKSAFIPLYWALVRPHLEYGMPACSPNLVADINHLERIQRLATRMVTGIRHLPTKRDCSGWAFIPCSGNDFGLFWIPNWRYSRAFWILILPSVRRGLRRHPYKPLQGERPPKKGVGIFVEGCAILEKTPGFRRNSSFCQYFKETVGESLDTSLSPSSPLAKNWSSISLPTPPSHPLTYIISICYPTPCYGFFRTVVSYFLPL